MEGQEQEKKEKTPLDIAREEFHRKHPNGISERIQEWGNKSRKRKTIEEREAKLTVRRDKINKELAELRAEKTKKERRERNHRLILFGAFFEKKILEVCRWDSREQNDEEIKKLASSIASKIN